MLTLFIASCNQNMLGSWHAMKNATVGAVKGLTNIGSENEFDRLSLETRKQNRLDEEEGVPTFDLKTLNVSSCDPQDISGQEEAQNLLEDIGKITDPLVGPICQCSPWGNCTKNLCSCDKLCPDDFSIFKRPEVANLNDWSAPEHSLAFRNGGGGSQYEMTQGYCWGHASVTSKFNRLAFFNKDQKPKYDINSADLEIQNKAIQEYKKYIDQIIKNNPTDIPGFANLDELSSHPSLQSYISDKVSTSWAKRAMSFQGLKVALGSSSMSEKENQEFIANIKTRLDAHMQPQIVFTKKGDRFKTHTLLIGSSYQEENGQTILCARDNNYDPESNQNCENKIFVGPDGELVYDMWGELGSARIAHNDSSDALIQRKALSDRCAKVKDCPLSH